MAKSPFSSHSVPRHVIFGGALAVIVIGAGLVQGFGRTSGPEDSDTTVSLSVSGCAGLTDGDMITETRDVKDFSALALRGGMDLDVTVGAAHSVSISAREDYISSISTDIDGDSLAIDMPKDDDGDYCTDGNVAVRITLPTLTALTVFGGVEAKLAGFDGGDLALDVRGAGDFDLQGRCDQLVIDMKGAGNIDADDLICSDVAVDLRGAGNVSVHASRSVDADLRGVGHIAVAGNPGTVTKNVSGLGVVRIK